MERTLDHESSASDTNVPGPISREEILRLAARWEAEDYLSAEGVHASSDDEIIAWLTRRGELLPPLNWNRHLVRDVARLDSEGQRHCFEALSGQILTPEEQDRWRPLRNYHREAAAQLVTFWRERRQPSVLEPPQSPPDLRR